MPIAYARRLTGSTRTARANRQLGFALAFVAGAINAGGFLAVQQYTSHMTGIVSAMADGIVLSTLGVVPTGAGALLAFVGGAATSAVMVNCARRHAPQSEYALPLLLEAGLLLGFGLLGAQLSRIEGLLVPATAMWLCFIMGLQNAVVTKLSHAEVRTTHVTGIVTDIGIDLGKLAYWKWGRHLPGALPPVRSVQRRLAILVTLVLFFFGGGVVGALGFRHLGYAATLPLALLLLALAGVPAIDDLRVWLRRGRVA